MRPSPSEFEGHGGQPGAESELQELRQRVEDLCVERDEVAAANARAAIEMAQMFEHRQRELEQQRTVLQEALDRAEAASSRKDEFLAKISHELRTPLNGIIGMTQLLTETLVDPGKREQARTALHSGKVLLEIINDLLDLSKAEAGELRLKDEVVDLWTLCSDVARLFAEHGKAPTVGFRCSVDPSVPRLIRGDVLRLRQVLVNLCGNARKFTDAGHVELRCAADPDDPDVLHFEVEDTGCGIPAESLQEVFESF